MTSFLRDKRRYIFILVLAFFLVISGLLQGTTVFERVRDYKISWTTDVCLDENGPKYDLSKYPLKHKKVVIASTFGFHHDVFLALAWTFERILGTDTKSVQVYAPFPFNYDFQSVVDHLGLYHGTVQAPENLVNNIMMDSSIDLIVFGTCEVDLRGNWNKDLLAVWDERDDAHKFMLVCIVHNVADELWQPEITEWSRRKALRLLPISEHVAKAFRTKFSRLADSTDPIIRTAGYEDILVDVHVPVLPLKIPLLQRNPERILSNVVIQGSFSSDRRDYANILAELNKSLVLDPRPWGYKLDESTSTYRVDDTLNTTPFHLYLVGSGTINIPEPLREIISVHVNLNYSDFYTLMGSFDLCIPAFATENGYLDSQASSTIAMAVECHVPILVTKRMRAAYTYIDNDGAVVQRPAAMTEMQAVEILRAGYNQAFPKGWNRDADHYRDFKEEIWEKNKYVVERILRDI